ncbi:MAG: hypothetical protein KDC54_24880 [Lewinella sp.]|nr:hypothetical protein [Lewinella sp.]
MPRALLLSVFCCCLAGGWVNAQPADSLRRQFQSAVAATDRLEAGLELAGYYPRRNRDSTFLLLPQLRQLADSLHDYDALIRTYLIEGLGLHNRSRLEEALNCFHTARRLAITHGLDRQLGSIYSDIGLTHRRGYHQDSAFYYFVQAEAAFSESGQPEEMWRPYWGMSQVYQEKGETEDAINYGLRALDLLETYGGRAEYGYVLYVFYNYLFQQKRYTELAALQRQRAAFLETDRPSQEVLEMPEHLALYFFLTDDQSQQEERLLEAIEHYDSLDNPFSKAWCEEDLADLYRSQEQWTLSRQYFDRAQSNFQQAGSPYRRGRCLYQLYQLAERQADYAAAFGYLESYKLLSDSLRNLENEQNYNQLRVAYETAQREQDLRIKELEVTQRTQQRNLLLAGSLGLIIFSLVGGWSLRQRLRDNKALAEQQQALQDERIHQLEQEKKLAGLSAMIEGQEQERMRIAQDLHDGLGGLLTSIKAHFSNFQPADQDPVYDKANELIDQACVDVRAIAHNMMPSALLLSGLPGALEDLAGQLRQHGLQCRLELMHLPEELPGPQAMSIYRILQELTNNIQKHARASTVLIQLLHHQQQLTILVEDDGRGFNPQNDHTGVGLSSIDARVRFLQGEWEIDSIPGEGTAVTIRLPV